jgi:hypothetical protein
LIGKSYGKRPLEKHRRRSEDDIKMDLTGVGWQGVDLIYLAQDMGQRCECCESINGPSGFIEYCEYLDQLRNY